jgi:hypothetical protein
MLFSIPLFSVVSTNLRWSITDHSIFNQDEKLIPSQLALALSGKHYTEASYHQHIKPNRFGLKHITILVIHRN